MSKVIDKWLEVGGTKIYSDIFNLNPTEYEREYSKNDLIVGHKINNGKLFALDFSQGFRMVTIAPVASGKTFMIRSIVDRAYDSGGYHVVFLADCKDEFRASCDPVQDKFWVNYLKGEEPRGMPVVSFRPQFFKSFNLGMPKSSIPFGFKLSELSATDFKSLVNYAKLPPLQMSVMNELSLKLRKHKKFIQTRDDLNAFIEKQDLDRNSQIGLKLKLKGIFDDEFITEDNVDFVEFLKKGYLIAINMRKFGNVGKGNTLPELTLSIIRRNIVNARQDSILKKRILMVVDESNRFVPSNKETALKEDIVESIELERSDRVDYMFVYQTIEAVPSTVMSNSRYVLIPSNAPTEVFVEAFKSTGVDRQAANTRQTRIARLKNRMMMVPYSWLVIDRMRGKYDTVRFLSPKSAHMEG